MNTLFAIGDGLARYLGWWASALVRWRDPRAPVGARRLLVLILGMPIFLLVQLGHGLCLLLDEVLFPGYRRIPLDNALVITGIPRSGTTFMHRTLAADTDRYTTLTTWEAILAPSILQRYMVRALARLDRLLGRPLARGLAWLTRRVAGGLDDIHEIGLEAAEEDYLCLLPAAGCFVMLLAFPAATGLQQLGHLDTAMRATRRRRLLRFYRACLQRHIYADGGHRHLLSKNAAFGSWLAGLRETLPEARFIVCVRQPASALSSQISSVSAAYQLFGVRPQSQAFQEIFLTMYADTLQHLATTIAAWPLERAAVADTQALQADAASCIRAIMDRLAIPETKALSEALSALRESTAKSGHQHRIDALALDRETLEERMTPAYRQLLELPHSVAGKP